MNETLSEKLTERFLSKWVEEMEFHGVLAKKFEEGKSRMSESDALEMLRPLRLAVEPPTMTSASILESAKLRIMRGE